MAYPGTRQAPLEREAEECISELDLFFYLFDVSFKFFKLGRGGAVAFTLLVVTIILGLILVRIFEDPARKQAMSSNND